MRRIWRPVLIGAAIAAATFGLAQAKVFEPSVATDDSAAAGDFYRGQLVFERECAGCHGAEGDGGTGPRLRDSGLDGDEIRLRIRQGGGVMPAGLVSGQEEADVVAYVVAIANR